MILIITGVSIILLAVAAGFAVLAQSLFAWLIVLILDLVITWGLYHSLKDKNPLLSQLAALFRLAYSSLLGVAVSFLLIADNTSFELIWAFGLILFGIHLLLVAPLTPKYIKLLLTIAGFSYLFVQCSLVFFPDMNIALIENILSIPMALGELSLGIWLIMNGWKGASLSDSKIPVSSLDS